MTLPHDAMIHEKREAECESGSAGAYFPGGVYEYKKTFNVPTEWEGKIHEWSNRLSESWAFRLRFIGRMNLEK